MSPLELEFGRYWLRKEGKGMVDGFINVEEGTVIINPGKNYELKFEVDRKVKIVCDKRDKGGIIALSDLGAKTDEIIIAPGETVQRVFDSLSAERSSGRKIRSGFRVRHLNLDEKAQENLAE